MWFLRVTADAGPDQQLCEESTTTLTGNYPPSGSVGNWTLCLRTNVVILLLQILLPQQLLGLYRAQLLIFSNILLLRLILARHVQVLMMFR